jgi:hypothetical protein
MNGFMVHADVTNASLSIPLDARAHNSTSWYKNQESGESRIMLKAVDPAGNTAQESIIGFDPGATENYDPLFDSYFLSGFAPMMYSVSKGENYALNTLPQWSEDLVIPISFIKNSSAGFSIELVKNDMGSQVLLTDKRDGITHNLSNGAYVFNAAEGDSPERFLLHFKALGIDDQNQKDNLPVLVWNNQNSLCISNPGKLNLTLELFTLTGSELINLRLNGESFSRIPISLSDGMYIARISASNKIKTIKMPVVH